MRNIILSVVLLVGITACERPGKEHAATAIAQLPVVAERVVVGGDTVVVCHPERLTDSIALPLSHFVENLEIIPLERKDEAYVRSSSVRVSENYILVHSSRNMPFRLFTRQGKFVCNIGSSGNGRGNYGQVSDFQLDEKHNRIYIMPWTTKQLIVYDLQGQFQGFIPLNARDEQPWDLPKSVFRVDGERKEITIATLPWKVNPRVAWVQDFEGNIRQEFAYKGSRTEMDYSPDVYHRHNTGTFDLSFLIFRPQKNDSLYHCSVTDNALHPVFTFDVPGNKAFPNECFEYPTCFVGTIIGRMEQDGFATFESRDHLEFFVDKRTLRGGRYGVYNDFLGHTDVYWFQHARNGFYCRNVSPSDLKEELQEALCRDDLSPDMRKKLSALEKSIDADRDNNYLMLGKLKQQ